MRVSDADFAKAIDRVVEYASRWPSDGVRFEFIADPALFLEPPLGPEHSLTDQHRSVFDARRPDRVDYDVLVSLRDLPLIRVDPFRAFGQEIDEVIFPVSELGSYARRVDYGAPTMYIGRFGHTLKMPFLEYYESHELAEHVTVHEFGHALGIPHMHQHPDLILPLDANGKEIASEKAAYAALDQARASFYRPIPEVQQVIHDALGIEVTPDIVRDHLIEVFRGNKAFSDWVALGGPRKQEHAAAAILDSVMTMPLYQCCAKVGDHSKCAQLGTIIRHPRSLDLEMLRRMYVRQSPAASEYPRSTESSPPSGNTPKAAASGEPSPS